MKELIEALQIFLKYGDVKYPFHCEHDELSVHGYDPTRFSEEDRKRLEELGFNISIEGEQIEDEDEGEVYDETRIYSYKYGSC